MLPISAILHPTDFSDQSKTAFEIARALARDYGAKLHLLHVVPYSSVTTVEGIPLGLPESEEKEAKEKLHALAATVTGVNIQSAVAIGDAAVEIVDFAKANQIDLIVLGTHGHAGLSRLLMGSVAENVQRHSPCPVLSVRTPFPHDAKK